MTKIYALLIALFCVVCGPGFAASDVADKVCANTDPAKNPNRVVLCEIWKLQSKERRELQIIDSGNIPLKAIPSSADAAWKKNNANSVCTELGYGGVQSFEYSPAYNPTGNPTDGRRVIRIQRLVCWYIV